MRVSLLCDRIARADSRIWRRGKAGVAQFRCDSVNLFDLLGFLRAMFLLAYGGLLGDQRRLRWVS